MKYLDGVLQRWRIRKARPFIPPGARLLDIGSADGVMFSALGSHIAGGIGIDPTLPENQTFGNCSLIRGIFPRDLPPMEPFDAITMLAVLEHIPAHHYDGLRQGCLKFLKPGGRVIITVPAPAVDKILVLLQSLRLIDGMSLHEHHGFRVSQTTEIFASPDFALLKHASFQLGLNNLFVFETTRSLAS